MKANEFVKKFGWEVAASVVNNQPKINSARYRKSDNKYSSTLSTGDSVCMIDLKTFVDAWELVESCGGLAEAKEWMQKDISDEYWDDDSEKRKQAIELVESCQ